MRGDCVRPFLPFYEHMREEAQSKRCGHLAASASAFDPNASSSDLVHSFLPFPFSDKSYSLAVEGALHMHTQLLARRQLLTPMPVPTCVPPMPTCAHSLASCWGERVRLLHPLLPDNGGGDEDGGGEGQIAHVQRLDRATGAAFVRRQRFFVFYFLFYFGQDLGL